jgi:IS30 family transposase
MTYKTRWRKVTPAIAAEVWRMRGQGESYAAIGDALGLRPAGVWKHVTEEGGVAPRPHRRRPNALTQEDREHISRLVASGCTIRHIANELGRSASTISREIRRNGGRHAYRAVAAERRAWQTARRPQACKLATHGRLRRYVTQKLKQKWSPQQIEHWLEQTFVDNPAMQISHETIYRTLYIQARGGLRAELTQYLRMSRKARRPRKAGAKSFASIVNGVSIHERPSSVEDRAVPGPGYGANERTLGAGHWEGDLLMGTKSCCIATLVERASRYVMLVKTPAKDTVTVTAALAKKIRRLPTELGKSLTWDRGSEMSSHQAFSVHADIDVYFCDPHSPWQRGSNENTNGLLRQYFPKGQPVADITQRELNRVARELNGRPRKTLGWTPPAMVLQQMLR